ncbi:hypothetical protein EZV73_06490 [Acidaminobacter sp. JC074]|uniref:MarR family winged helix-turn-helix transcriptional regulator n=1 Tax=Acidaminobacter sp. JC074 TaxID=2530199 RepID=UPI001F106310|nr:hypothetical protein [Acidaminobacter sp. JC074]MCH4887210.1 hypothetical protein [Acidaminobacter sp. JC074]
MDYSREIFARLFLLTRKWEVLFNRKNTELTLKQMMCLIVVNSGFDHDPTIKEIAGVLSTSHQNIKAIVLQLEKKSFVSLYKDSQDKRITRVKISETKASYWQKQNVEDEKTMGALFEGISEEHLKITLETILKLDENVSY